MARTRRVVRRREFSCYICRINFRKRAKLLRHIREHHEQVPSIVVCRLCCHTFRDISQLEAHLRQAHSSPHFRIVESFGESCTFFEFLQFSKKLGQKQVMIFKRVFLSLFLQTRITV